MMTQKAFADGLVRSVLRLPWALLRQRSGATAIEYGLVAALVSIVIVGGAVAMAGGVEGLFDHAGGEVVSAMPSGPTP